MTDTKHIYFFVGKPGSGKGTQAKLAGEALDIPYFSSGQNFRNIAKEDSVLGKKVHSVISVGDLLPSWMPEYMFNKLVFNLAEDRAILDGYGRTEAEARHILDVLCWLGIEYSIVNISISDDTVRERSDKRQELEHREDDAHVDHRIEEFYEKTAKAIDVFREEKNYFEIDGEADIETIHEDIMKILNGENNN